MRLLPRALCAALSLVFIAVSPAVAATPSAGSVSLAQPSTSWTGAAPGYGVVVVNSLAARTCEAPFCDSFALEVKDAGDLTIGVTAKTASGFTQVDVVRPDGSILSNDGASGQPTTELVIKRAAAGAYEIRTHINRNPAQDASYSALATLVPSTATAREEVPLGEGKGEGGPRDATVVAVIDSSFNPYHWDFLATKMPQALNADRGDDMPLNDPASEWLPGFPEAATLERLPISLEHTDAKASMDALREEDAKLWAGIQPSSRTQQKLYYLPGTKIVAAATFAPAGKIVGPNDAHGAGTTSAAAGNLHGTCPECLLVILQYSGEAAGEAAIDWAMSQPWIDVVSNSYGFGQTHSPSRGYTRDNVYDNSNLEAQRDASERGQSIVFSAGNGIDNAFLVPNSTEFSSQKGPDWMLTVGAVSPPEDGHYDAFTDAQTEERSGGFVGAGKPVDVASLGIDYPNAYYSETVGGTGDIGFSGTSNAAPVVTGIYARSLYEARRQLGGRSRIQEDGVIARGRKYKCGDARRDCELGDGRLTADELRTRLLHGAVPTGNGLTVSGQLVNPTLAPVGEETLMAEGHGTYYGRVRKGGAGWEAEQERVTGPMLGTADVLARPAGEREWMIVDSYCRQQNWGAWAGGYYVDGLTQLPGDDPAWPVRSARERACPGGPHS